MVKYLFSWSKVKVEPAILHETTLALGLPQKIVPLPPKKAAKNALYKNAVASPLAET